MEIIWRKVPRCEQDEHWDIHGEQEEDNREDEQPLSAYCVFEGVG